MNRGMKIPFNSGFNRIVPLTETTFFWQILDLLSKFTYYSEIFWKTL